MAVVSRVEIALDSTKAAANAKSFAKSMDGVAGATRDVNGRLRDVNGKFIGAGKAAAAAGAGARAAVPGVAALGTAFKAALGPIAVFTTAAGALASAFSILSKQDFAEAKVRSLGVDSEELTKRLSDVSRELAGQADVVELTGAAYDVASAGFTNAADAANILKAASLGATGGFSDINTVGDAATSVLNAYGLEADKAGKLVDGFIQTQNDGKIVIGEYAANIAKVAPVAAALGVPLEEVNAAVAQITAGGQGAEVTFTALKTAFSAIAAGKVGKEFEGLGIEINASTLKADGLAGTLEKIKKSGADAGTVIKAFGTEAGPSILALLNNTEKYNQLLENQEQSQGAAAKAAFEASDTINGALKRLQTAFTNIFADQSELGILLKGTFQVAAVTVEVFGAALKILLAPIRGVVSGVQAFFQALSPFKENINLAYELEQGFQAVMKGVSVAADVITGLYFKISQGAATVIGDVLTLANNIRQAVVGVFSGLASTIKQVMAGLFEQLPAPIKFIIEQASKGYQAVGSFLGQAASGVVSQVSGTVQELAAVGGALNKSSPVTPAANAIQETNTQLGGNNQAKLQKEKVKMTQQEFDLRQAIRDAKLTEGKIDDVNAKFNLEKFEIGERFNDDVLAKRNALLEAEQEKNSKLQQIEQDRFNAQAKADKDAADAAQRRLEADPGYQMQQQLEKLLDTQNQAAFAAESMGSAFADAFGDVVTGAKTGQEALAGMLKSIAADFLGMAKKIIAQQLAMILYGTIMKALGIGGVTSGQGVNLGKNPNFFNQGPPPLPPIPHAEGGYVSGPTNALIGEGGEPEYVIPESKMRESMSRYSRGSRGNSVIPTSGGGAEDSGGGTAVAAPIDVRYTVERINSVDYVTADQFQSGMKQAASQGAKQGEQQTLKRLQMSGGTRKRLGM